MATPPRASAALRGIVAAGPVLVFACYTFGYLLSNFFRAANAVISGDLSRDIGLTPADLGLMTSLFYAGFAAVQLPLGAALDRFGPRVTIPSFMTAAVVGSAVFANATEFVGVASGRVLIGIGMAGGLMGLLKVFAAWYPPARLATISGLAVGIGAAGALVAATPLAWANTAFGWRAVFAVASGATLISALLIVLLTRSAPKPVAVARRVDPAAPGFGQIFRDRRFWHVAPLNFFLLGSLLSIQTLWAGPYLFDVLQLDQVMAGNLLAALSSGIVVGYLVGGALADRFGSARVVTSGIVLFLLCLAILAWPFGPLPIALIVPIYFLFGLSGTANLLLLNLVRSLYPESMSGRAVTALNLFGFSGSALIQWWMGLMIGLFAADEAGRSPQIAYASAFGAALVCCVVAAAWFFALPKRT